MSIYQDVTLQLIPFTKEVRILPSAAPSYYVYGLNAMSGDSSGSTVTAEFTLPGGFFVRWEAISLFSSDAAADVGAVHCRSKVDWIEDTLPVLNVLFECAMTMTAFSATRSHNDVVAMNAWVDQLRRIPIGRLNGESTGSALRFQLENNVNLQSYTFEVFGVAWETPALGLPNYLDSFNRS